MFRRNMAAFIAATTVMWAADPFVGSWRFDPATSQQATGRAIGAPESFRLEGEGDDLQQTIEGPDQNGVVRKHIMRFKLDRKEYATSKGETVLCRRVDAHTFELTSRHDGTLWQWQRWTVSPDEKTLTIAAAYLDGKTGQPYVIKSVFGRQ